MPGFDVNGIGGNAPAPSGPSGLFLGLDPTYRERLLQNQQTQIGLDAATAFKGGLPTNPDGSPDLDGMASTLIQKGDLGSGLKFLDTGLRMQGINAALAGASALANGPGGGAPGGPGGTPAPGGAGAGVGGAAGSLAPLDVYAHSIGSIESGNNYAAVGPSDKNGNAPLGRYQVMSSNVPSWTKDVLGQAMTPQQFLASPDAQDAVFRSKFGGYVQQYGNPMDAASMWFSGRPLMRYEIPDGSAAINPNALRSRTEPPIGDLISHPSMWASRLLPASDALSHDALFAAYPDLRDLPTVIGRQAEHGPAANDWSSAFYHRGSPDGSGMPEHVGLKDNTGPLSDLTGSLLHEFQHAIQNREGFAGGSAPSNFSNQDWMNAGRPEGDYNDWAQGQYKTTYGEVEARNAQRRQNFTAEDRGQYAPWDTYDVSDGFLHTDRGSGARAASLPTDGSSDRYTLDASTLGDINELLGLGRGWKAPDPYATNNAASRVFDLPAMFDAGDPRLMAGMREMAKRSGKGRFFDDMVARERASRAAAAAAGQPDPGLSIAFNAHNAALAMARQDGLDTAVLRGLKESDGSDQVAVLTPNRVRGALSGDLLYSRGLPVPAGRGDRRREPPPPPPSLFDGLLAAGRGA